MKFGSLFAGIGGFDLGFERAGMQCLWQVEIDKNCNRVLAYHWPNIKRYEDVREVGKDNLQAVDLISGGFPCQDLSVAGRRAGLAGERSGLFWEFLRIIEELRPRWVVIENVPGLLSSNKGKDFTLLIEAVAECGYGVAWRVLDSQYFGVPQRRRRMFIIGHLGGVCPPEILFESEGGEGHTAEGREEGQGITASIEEGFANRGYPTGQTAEGVRADSHGALPMIAFQQNQRDEVRQMEVAGAIAAEPGSHQQNYVFSQGNLRRQAGANPSDDGKVPALRAEMGDHRPYIAGMGVRRLTPTECERLQGFPDGWTEMLSDTARYKALGNAVTVNVAEWIGRRFSMVQLGMEI